MAKGEGIDRDSGRQSPAAGAHILPGQPNIFFVTVNSKDTVPWMADIAVQNSLAEIWRNEATAWLVGYYLNHARPFAFVLRPARLSFRNRSMGAILEEPIQSPPCQPTMAMAKEIVPSPPARPDRIRRQTYVRSRKSVAQTVGDFSK